MTYFHKSGVVLRKLEKDDLPLLLELKREGWWGTHSIHLLNMDDQIKWYNSLSHTDLCMILEYGWEKVAFSRYSSIDWLARTARITGSMFRQHRQEEVIKKCCAAGVDFAFEILNLHRLDTSVIETNLAAQKYEIGYLGFNIEGKRRKAVYKCGVYYDSLVLGLLREDWQNQPRVKAYGGSCNWNFSHEHVK